MERDGDLLLNVSCSRNEPSIGAKRLPLRMPDGSRIDSSAKLIKKINKTHHPASISGKVFIPNHKLPVLDEFGLLDSRKEADPEPKASILKHNTDDRSSEVDSSSHKAKRKKRKQRDEEPKIIPKEVQAVAGGLPPSFPKYRIKKFTEEYQVKKQRLSEGVVQEDDKKRRRSFVPGLNPRKREKGPHLFTDQTLRELEDLHPHLASNLEQNFDIKQLTRIQSLALPELLKTRFKSGRQEFMINSGVGTGKILCYVIPIINNLALLDPKIDRTSGIHALVLLPTRELAAQVNDIFSKLCRSFLWIVPGLLTGGERKKSEKARLRKGLNILITTPGRLIDHIEHSKSLELSKMKYCVLADMHKLLDPERVEVAKRIAIALRKRLPNDCTRCLVTATMTKKIEKLAEILVNAPKVIDAFKEFE